MNRVGPYTEDCLKEKSALDKLMYRARRMACDSPVLRPHLLILARKIRAGEVVTLGDVPPFYPESCKLDGEGKILGGYDIPPASSHELSTAEMKERYDEAMAMHKEVALKCAELCWEGEEIELSEVTRQMLDLEEKLAHIAGIIQKREEQGR